MTINSSMNASRRAFMKRASALSVAGVAGPLAMNLAALSEAAAATATDYKALVCVFLYGGNDNGNTLIPYDQTNYDLYNKLRPTLAYARTALDATVLNPSVALSGGQQFSLAPELAPLLPIFNDGHMATLLNVGTLIQPTTKQQYLAKTVPLPSKLFSHNDQQSEWQSSAPEGATSGWGGRMGDLFQSGNGSSTFTCVNVSGNAVYLSGESAVQYQVTSSGSIALKALKAPLFGSAACSKALQALVTQQRGHILEAEYNRVMARSIDANALLSASLQPATAITTAFPATNTLGDQLKLVARMIASANELKVKRQVFFVSLGGFDTHDGLLTVHPGLLTKVSEALSAFYNATVELGVSQQVTAFTASDFGRTLSGNNDGSDHGWGSSHFVVGGAVKGQRIYGTPPAIASNGPDDVGQGRMIPTTGVDQYAATLARWFGVSDTDLLTVLPNLKNFDVSARNLGFV
jgi:uncharacterized protein (DUF1501 family)